MYMKTVRKDLGEDVAYIRKRGNFARTKAKQQNLEECRRRVSSSSVRSSPHSIGTLP
jgi:hypothetical protein